MNDSRQTRALALYLLELVIQDYALSQHSPSLLALCCLEIADLYFGQCTRPDPLYAANHTADTLQDCIGEIDKLLDITVQNCKDLAELLANYMEWFEGGDAEADTSTDKGDKLVGNEEEDSEGEDQWVVLDNVFKRRKAMATA